MIIPIDDRYRLHSDTNQWTIQRRKVVKGEDKWESFKFFHDPSHAVTALIQMQIRECDVSTLAGALDEVKNVTARVLHALAPEFEVRHVTNEKPAGAGGSLKSSGEMNVTREATGEA